jgi:hypothetical protein
LINFILLESNKIHSLYFTFQFYKYGYLSTERLEIIGEESPFIFARLDKFGKLTDHRGLILRFYGEGPNFINYLESKTLSIDIWDGDSLLQIGTIGIDLKYLLRQQKEGVQFTDEFDIIQLQDSSSSSSSLLNQHLINSKIHLKIANIGRISEGFPNDFKSLTLIQQSKYKSNEITKSFAKTMIDKDPELLIALHSRKINNFQNLNSMEEDDYLNLKRRKFARFQSIKNLQNKKTNEYNSISQSRSLKEKDLKIIQQFRER